MSAGTPIGLIGAATCAALLRSLMSLLHTGTISAPKSAAGCTPAMYTKGMLPIFRRLFMILVLLLRVLRLLSLTCRIRLGLVK